MANGAVTTSIADAELSDGPAGPARTIAYQPALDGVRALAVIAVLLFHADVPGFGGGYLGVSVFFTLSGYLITSLLAAEMDRTGRVALGEFYARRARRLLPASILVVLLVALAAATTDWFRGVDELRNQIVGSLLQVANWVFLASDGSYQDLLQESAGVASPLEHYWSLAIEEQFYWIWPLAFVGLWRLGRSHRGRLRIVGSITVAAVVAAPVIAAVWGADAAYWSTPARAAEILLGAFLGLALLGRTLPASVALLAPAALLVLGAAIVLFPSSGGPAYAGALPAIGVASVALLIGLQAESGTRRLCSAPPLVWLGTISYGVYLIHWPIFVVMNEERVGFDGPLLLVARLAVTLGLAQLSFVLFERPIRQGWRTAPRTTLLGGLGATGAAVVATFLLVGGPAGSYWVASSDAADAAAIVVDDAPLELAPQPSLPAGVIDSEDVPDDVPVETVSIDDAGPVDELVEDGRDPTSAEPEPAATNPPSPDGAPEPTVSPTVTSVPTTTTEPPAVREPIAVPNRPVRVIVAGDSTAEAIGAGMVQWAADRPAFAQVEVRSAPGCGFVRGGELLFDGEWVEHQEGCANYFYRLIPEQATELSADVVVLVTTSWDVADRRWPDEPGATDDTSIVAAADRVLADFDALTAEFLGAGVPEIVWLEMPRPDPNWEDAVEPSEDPERHAVLHDAMSDIAARFPDRVSVVDFDDWFEAQGLAADEQIRPDGVHLTPDASTTVVEDYLADEVLRAALGLA